MKRLLVTLCLSLLFTGIISSQMPDTSFWATNGPVRSVVLMDTTLYVGGDFSMVSPVTGSLVRTDTATAIYDPSQFKVDGPVYAMCKDPLGNTYVAGSFSRAGRTYCSNIFRILPNGQFDHSFTHTVDGTVYTMLYTSNMLIIGGSFSQVDNQPRQNIAGFDSAAVNLAEDFIPYANGPVYCMAYNPAFGMVVVGGDFTYCGGRPVAYLAMIDLQFGNAFGFNATPWTTTPNADAAVRSVIVHNDKVIIGGEFTSFGPYQRRGLAVLDNYTSLLETSLSAGMNGNVYDMSYVNGKIYLAGDFSLVGGNFRDNLACVDTNFNLLNWSPGTNGPVWCLDPGTDSTYLFAGGDFTSANGNDHRFAAILDTAGAGSDRTFNGNFNGPVRAFSAAPSNDIYVGGVFSGMNGVERNNFVAMSTITGKPLQWNPVMDDPVSTLYIEDSILFVAGDFTVVNGQNRSRIAAFDLRDTSLTAFNPGVNGWVRTIDKLDSLIFLGGNFTLVNNELRNNIACVSWNDSQVTNWDPSCMGTVNTLIADTHWVYVAGYYSSISGVTRNNLSRIRTTDAVADWNWICDTDDGVYQAELWNGELVVAGWFGQVDGIAAPDMAMIDTGTLSVSTLPVLTNGYVRTFVRSGDDYFVGGNFSLLNNAQAGYFFNYDAGDDLVDPWMPLLNSSPVTMDADSTQLVMGGGMTYCSGVYHPFLQVLDVEWVTSVEEESEIDTENVRLYPNPVADQLTIETEQALTEEETIFITDITGRVVSSFVWTAGSNRLVISVNDLSPGLYHLSSAGGSVTVSAFTVIR